MNCGLIKLTALRLVSWGLKVPEASIDRFNELTHLKKLLAFLDINCVLDVGANQGQFAHELRAIGYEGYIISFEPVKQEFNKLLKSFEKDEKWIGYQIALGSENKESQINVSEITLMSSLLELNNGQSLTKKQAIEVKRLDDLFEEIVQKIPNASRLFLKMDTQGYDLEVFKGATECLRHIYGLQSELSVQPLYKDMPHYIDSLSIYEKAGYELYNLSVVNRVFNGGLLELNAFMYKLV